MSSRVAVVAGGSRGIGRAIGLELGRAGFDIAIGYRARADAASSAAEEIRALGRDALTVRADISTSEGCAHLLEQTVEGLGNVYVCVSSAGQLGTARIDEASDEELERQLATNARGSFLFVRSAARHMIARGGGGRIILITSEAAVRPYPELGAYCMSKAAQRMLTQVAAMELAEHGIRVNAVAPGTTETDLNREALADPDKRHMLLGSILLGRPGQPEDVAKAVSFLASGDAEFITGATLAVDGGAAIH